MYPGTDTFQISQPDSSHAARTDTSAIIRQSGLVCGRGRFDMFTCLCPWPPCVDTHIKGGCFPSLLLCGSPAAWLVQIRASLLVLNIVVRGSDSRHRQPTPTVLGCRLLVTAAIVAALPHRLPAASTCRCLHPCFLQRMQASNRSMAMPRCVKRLNRRSAGSAAVRQFRLS